MIVFLCSDLSSYTTGTVVTVDGGAAATQVIKAGFGSGTFGV